MPKCKAPTLATAGTPAEHWIKTRAMTTRGHRHRTNKNLNEPKAKRTEKTNSPTQQQHKNKTTKDSRCRQANPSSIDVSWKTHVAIKPCVTNDKLIEAGHGTSAIETIHQQGKPPIVPRFSEKCSARRAETVDAGDDGQLVNGRVATQDGV